MIVVDPLLAWGSEDGDSWGTDRFLSPLEMLLAAIAFELYTTGHLEALEDAWRFWRTGSTYVRPRDPSDEESDVVDCSPEHPDAWRFTWGSV